MGRIGLLFSVPAVIVLCSGCGLITGVDDNRCDAPPEVRIEVGDEVWFRWGKCWVDQLTVVSNEFQAVWTIEGEVGSPVQYGVAKEKVDVRAGPEPLQPGSAYVLVISVDKDGGSSTTNWSFTR